MPYCSFCGKLCATAPGLERHISCTPECKQASHEKFSQYANSIWDDVPANINHVEQHWQPEPLANLPDLPDFHLEEDIQIADETIDEQEINVPQQHPLMRSTALTLSKGRAWPGWPKGRPSPTLKGPGSGQFLDELARPS